MATSGEKEDSHHESTAEQDLQLLGGLSDGPLSPVHLSQSRPPGRPRNHDDTSQPYECEQQYELCSHDLGLPISDAHQIATTRQSHVPSISKEIHISKMGQRLLLMYCFAQEICLDKENLEYSFVSKLGQYFCAPSSPEQLLLQLQSLTTSLVSALEPTIHIKIDERPHLVDFERHIVGKLIDYLKQTDLSEMDEELEKYLLEQYSKPIVSLTTNICTGKVLLQNVCGMMMSLHIEQKKAAEEREETKQEVIELRKTVEELVKQNVELQKKEKRNELQKEVKRNAELQKKVKRSNRKQEKEIVHQKEMKAAKAQIEHLAEQLRIATIELPQNYIDDIINSDKVKYGIICLLLIGLGGVVGGIIGAVVGTCFCPGPGNVAGAIGGGALGAGLVGGAIGAGIGIIGTGVAVTVYSADKYCKKE